MKTAITASLVPAARGGPFVYHDGLADAMRRAEDAGYDAIEIFATSPSDVDAGELRRLKAATGLAVAAVGTGAGAVVHGLTITDPDADARRRAIDYVTQMIRFGAEHDAPAIIGSMQGRSDAKADNGDRDATLGRLRDSLDELGDVAAASGTTLLYEPLNRYETDLCVTLTDAAALIEPLGEPSGGRVRLLADLFHMNIEESDVAVALRDAGPHIGHVHFVDSNRSAAGLGHTDFGPIAGALRAIDYGGYLSVEAFPRPDAETTAKTTMNTVRRLFG